MNRCGELCKQSGLKFGYHNHDFEFSKYLNGIRLYDIILKQTNPGVVKHQLDVGNIDHQSVCLESFVEILPWKISVIAP